MRLPVGSVVGAAGHHDLHDRGLLLLGFDVVVWGTGPVGAELDEFVVEVHANPAAHADVHRLAVHRFRPPLEVLDQVFRDQANPLLAADECFQLGPLGLELLLATLFFPFGDFLKLGIDLGQLGFVQAQLGDAAFVVDRDRGLVAANTKLRGQFEKCLKILAQQFGALLGLLERNVFRAPKIEADEAVLRLPAGIAVVNVDLTIQLEQLAFQVQAGWE